MISKSRRPQAGFTVIEMILVLAVAGMILSMVLWAIPSLQRNGRNNQRKQDVATILQAVSRYALNNSANFPSGDALDPGSARYYLRYSKLSYYTGSNSVKPYSYSSETENFPRDFIPVTNIDNVEVHNYAKCDPTQQGKAISTAADYRDIVALYAIETGRTATAPRCQQL